MRILDNINREREAGMKLKTISEILTWFYGETQIIKNSMLSGEISQIQSDDRTLNAINKAHAEILKLKG
jgi:hypothetical protein